MQNKIVVVLSLIALIALFFVGKNLYITNESAKVLAVSENNSSILKRDYSFEIGSKNAKVQLVEFFDPACATCAQFHPYVKEIMKQNKGNIKLVLRYAPFHQNSNYAVKMLEGAKEQGKFMETLEFMFATQRYWIKNHTVDPRALWNMLPKVEGLDMEKLGKFMNDPKADAIIKQDLEDAQKLGVTKTPGYIVNGKPLQTFGLKNLIDLVNSEL